TKTGSTLGTVAYMSYEQVQGNEVDHRTDIWSLGVVLYEMLAGQLPFEGDHEHIVTYSVLTKAPPSISALNPSVSVELEQIIHKCLAKNPEERYQYVEELLDDLESIPADVRQSKRKKTSLKTRFLKRKNAALPGIVTFLAVAIIIATSYYFFTGSHNTIDSIAVLPLENLIGDSEQDYFVDGMTEALITELSQISALRVISRTSIMQYKGVKKPLPEIGRELNVDAIVEGAVFREGDRVRITAQLIETETDHHLWASHYERDLSEVLALQSEVARAIASEIQVTLTPQEEVRLTKVEPIDPEVYELYLQGQFHHRTYTREGMEKAIDYFGRAIARDSTFARAYAALAWAYSSLLDLYQAPKEKETIAAKEKAARDKAWQLDDTIAELHAARGFGYLNRGRSIELAEPHFERAVELEPSNARTRWFYGYYLTAIGQADRSIQQLQKAIALDPLNAFLNMAAYWPFFCAGEYDLAIEQATRARELNPDMPHIRVALGRIYVQQHRFDEAITAYRKAIELLPGDTPYSLFALAFLGHACGLAGRTEEAARILEELQPKAKDFALPVALAILNIGLGDKEAALQWLESGYDWQVGQLFWLKPDPVFDSLRSEPRFQNLLNRINLPEEQVITRDR
ncbi:MAG: tetratricopeptide repeat protein, partial [Phycisphaerae bacterium]|nr:tetratricopeptide repeat protein [Phycisphaerae bacterium]NIX27756.1 tetratricopeptide repeat protein [Phycisphaerae bacterium]